jgi:hypothetical protein
MSTTPKSPERDDIWEDTLSEPLEWCSVLHVSATHVTVQRRYGVARYEGDEFLSRFRFIMKEDVL